jgi:hypothetical protein
MRKSFLVGFIAGLVLIAVAGAGASKLQNKTLSSRDKAAEEEQFRTEAIDATPVQLGVLTSQQRFHSKLYAHYLQLRTKTISDLVTQFKGKHRVVGTVVEVPLMEVVTQPKTPESYFGKLADQSDAVIRGKVISKTSQVTEDGGFIFTDYDVSVSEVVKNNSIAPFGGGATITVTHPGGKVLIDGIIIKAEDQAALPLPDNHEVVLFLKYIAQTGAYQLTNAIGSFEIDDLKLRPLTGIQLPPGVLQDSQSFLRTVRMVESK